MSFVLAFTPPEVPLIVIVDVPVLAVPLTVNVSALLVTVGFRLNPAVTPLGRPDTESVTKPFAPLIMIVLVPFLPRAIVSALGLSDRVKLTFTVSLIVVV